MPSEIIVVIVINDRVGGYHVPFFYATRPRVAAYTTLRASSTYVCIHPHRCYDDMRTKAYEGSKCSDYNTAAHTVQYRSGVGNNNVRNVFVCESISKNEFLLGGVRRILILMYFRSRRSVVVCT